MNGTEEPRSPSRRALLRGAGAAVLPLPLLPRRGDAAEPAFPKRLVVYHVPEGVPVKDGDIFASTPDYWWPGADLATLPQATAPLAKHRSRLLFLRGFGFPGQADDDDRHVAGMHDLLTGRLRGAPTRAAGGVTVPAGMSIDQILAQHLGKPTPYKSYALGVLNHLEGVQAKRRISHVGATGGRDPVNDPLKAYDDLLASVAVGGDAQTLSLARRRLLLRKSVLDGLVKEASGLACELGADGKRKLDAYLAGVRDIETRLAQQLAQGGGPKGGARPPRPAAAGEPAYWSARENAPALGDLQARTAAAALAADVTRVVVFQWNQSVSRQSYPWLSVSGKEMDGHSLAHASALKPEEAKRWAADRATVFEWYTHQLVKFLDLLAETPEGGGSLLDNTAVLYCSEMGNGHHYAYDLPFLLIGSAGGAFKQGKVLDGRTGAASLRSFRQAKEPWYKGHTYRMHADLLTAIVQGFGLPLPEIGLPEENGRAFTEMLA